MTKFLGLARLAVIFAMGGLLAACAGNRNDDPKLEAFLPGIWSLECNGSMTFNDLFVYRDGDWESQIVMGLPKFDPKTNEKLRPMIISRNDDLIYLRFKNEPDNFYVYKMVQPAVMRLWSAPGGIKDGKSNPADPTSADTPFIFRCVAF